MEYVQPVGESVSRVHLVWQPGWQTANERREEWFEEHGWAARPTRETLAGWAALKRAEDEYHADGHFQIRDEMTNLNRSTPTDQVEIGADVAPFLVVPAHPQFGEQEGSVAIELFRLDSGQPVLTAFTSVQRLVDTLGNYQPWVQVPGTTVVSISSGILLIDPDRGVVQPLWTEDRFNALKGAMND